MWLLFWPRAASLIFLKIGPQLSFATEFMCAIFHSGQLTFVEIAPEKPQILGLEHFNSLPQATVCGWLKHC